MRDTVSRPNYGRLDSMRYKILGRSGLRVPEIALGTMMMGPEGPGHAGPLESRRLMEAYAERGGNFFDSAPVYNWV